MHSLYSHSTPHIAMFVQGCSCTLFQETHWMHTHTHCNLTVLNKSPFHIHCSVRCRSLHCHPFRIPISNALHIYIHISNMYIFISSHNRGREFGPSSSPCPDNANEVQDSRGWCLTLCQALVACVLLFFFEGGLLLLAGELCNQVFEDAHRL